MRITNILFFVSAVLMVACEVNDKPQSKKTVALNNETDSISYYIGVYTGMTLKEAGYTTFEKEEFDSAFQTTFNAKTASIQAYAQADSIIGSYVKAGRYLKTLREGEAFLAKNKNRPGIQTTTSGLQYEIIREGTGLKPSIGDSIVLFFTGTTLDEKVFMKFDSIPAKMLLKEGTRGGIEALQLMREGAKYKFYVPTELGYGKEPLPGGIVKPNMALIYTIELLAVIKNQQQ